MVTVEEHRGLVTVDIRIRGYDVRLLLNPSEFVEMRRQISNVYTNDEAEEMYQAYLEDEDNKKHLLDPIVIRA